MCEGSGSTTALPKQMLPKATLQRAQVAVLRLDHTSLQKADSTATKANRTDGFSQQKLGVPVTLLPGGLCKLRRIVVRIHEHLRQRAQERAGCQHGCEHAVGLVEIGRGHEGTFSPFSRSLVGNPGRKLTFGLLRKLDDELWPQLLGLGPMPLNA